jgi:hypothetical protein
MLVAVLAVGCSAQAPAATPTLQPPSQPASSPLASVQGSAAVFPTPEDAIRQYMTGVAEAEVSTILQTCAIDEMSAGFRFDLMAERLQAFVLQSSVAPAEYPFYADINRTLHSDAVLHQVLMLSYSLLSSEQIDGRTIAPVDKARADTFVTQVDPSRLAGLTVEDIRFPNAKLEHESRYLASAAANASIYGADEQTQRLVLFSFDGKTYDIGFTLLRYGSGWKVSYQDSVLAGTNSLGTAQPTTVEEFDRVTSGG